MVNRCALVVGGDSVIGAALARALIERQFAVTATTRRCLPQGSDSIRWISVDLAEVASEGTVDIPANDVTFLCAAITGFAECEGQPNLSEAVNVTANCTIAKEVAACGGRTVFLSSSAIYDGHVPLRCPADAPDGETLYGRQKAEAERLLSEIDRRLAIVRLAKVLDPAHTLIRNWIGELGAGRSITPFHDLVTAPVSLADAVGLLCKLAEGTEHGVFQLSAARDVTYADIARHIASRLDAPAGLLTPTSALEVGIEPGAVPDYATLDSQRSLMLLNTPPIDPLQVVDTVFGLVEAPAQSVP